MQVFTRNRNHALAVAMTRHRLRVEARRNGLIDMLRDSTVVDLGISFPQGMK